MCAPRGDALRPEERAVYEAGLRQLDANESFADAAPLQKTRAKLTALETEQAQLKAQHEHLKQQIAALEASLDERARETLGLATLSERG